MYYGVWVWVYYIILYVISLIFHCRRGDVLWGHILDVLIGIIIMLAFIQYNTAEQLSELLLSWADVS